MLSRHEQGQINLKPLICSRLTVNRRTEKFVTLQGIKPRFSSYPVIILTELPLLLNTSQANMINQTSLSIASDGEQSTGRSSSAKRFGS